MKTDGKRYYLVRVIWFQPSRYEDCVVKAKNREHAKSIVQKKVPGATYYVALRPIQSLN